jgi:hypothetical protein
MKEAWAYHLALTAGLLPVAAVNLALAINMFTGLDACIPYLQGCYSVSQAVRSGPGLWVFKLLAAPAALAMAMTWAAILRRLERLAVGTPRNRRSLLWLGLVGAVFFLVYAFWLGSEGELYRWLRRYGVVFYFAGTGLAQLTLVAILWPQRKTISGGQLESSIVRLGAMVGLVWGLGVASALKRKLIDDPGFLDRVENALEWNFALALSIAFLGVAALLKTRD